MPSDDLGPFAQLTPMQSDFEAGVRIDALWKALFEQLETFDRRRDVLLSLTGIDVDAGWPSDRLGELISRATAVLVQDCVRDGLISIYVHNPQSGRFHRLPKDGLVSEFVSTTRIGGQDTSHRAARTSEHSWTTGTLFEIDCDKSLFRLARERVPLMTSEAEAQAVLAAFPRLLAKEVSEPASDPLPTAEPERRARWIADLQARERWPLREALLWIATRDLEFMADMVLTSLWEDNDPAGLPPPGVEWVLGHIDTWSDDHSFVERRPDGVLMRELRAGRVRASGVYEAREQRTWIDAHLWEDLEFGAWPFARRSGSAARQRRQVHGLQWAGHWIDLLFERDALIVAFPAIEPSQDDSDAAVDETIRRLSDERGSPIPRNKGAQEVRRLHPSRTITEIKARIIALFPKERPGPKGPRKRAA